MVTYNGNLATAYAATPSTGGPANWVLAGLIDSPVRCIIDKYAPVGTEAAGSVIRFFTDGVNKVLPAGANLIKIEFYMSGSTSSLTFSVGDNASATRYASASTGPATAGATTISCIVSGLPYVVGTNPRTNTVPTETNGDDQIIVTTGGATLSATTSITSAILYYTLTS